MIFVLASKVLGLVEGITALEPKRQMHNEWLNTLELLSPEKKITEAYDKAEKSQESSLEKVYRNPPFLSIQ